MVRPFVLKDADVGINTNNLALLEKKVLIRLPSDYSVYELGNQMVRADPDYPAEQYYRTRGCAVYDCIDLNGAGTINADLGTPLDLPPRDLVTDFGTSEHVFNVSQCWINMHSMCKVGGIIAFEKIYDGGLNHGMYNLQPTFISSLASANKYQMLHFEKTDTTGDLRMRGAFIKTREEFKIPTQGRYRRMLDGI